MRTLGVVLGSVLLVLLPACGDGGGGSEASALQLLRATSDVAEEAGTARVAMSLDTDGAAGLGLEAEGLVEFESHRLSMTMAMPEIAGESLGDIQLVVDGTTLYFHLGQLQDLLGVDTEWMTMDLEQLTDAQGFDLSQLQVGAATDPTEVLEALQGASDDIEELGTEEIRGEETTHYRATIDLRKAAEEQGLDATETDELLDGFGADTLPIDVWIDDAGRARRLQFEGQTGDGEQEISADVTVDLYDYGTDARVEVPAADEVTDVTEQLLEFADAFTD